MKKVTDKVLVDAIKKNAGIISGIRRTLKEKYGIDITRSAIYKRKESSKVIADAFMDAEETVLDTAESNIIEYIKDGNLKATMFYLRLKGRKRGYSNNDTTTEQEKEDDKIIFTFERNGTKAEFLRV